MASKVRQSQKKAPSMSLSARRYVTFLPDTIFPSVEGANTVITAISSRHQVSKLTMSHNRIGGDGFRKLFDFLCSFRGRKYQIEDIDLHNCGMDDDDLLALSEYIQNNSALNALHLQQNNFGTDLNCVARFADAINRSRVRTLTLSSLSPSTAAGTITHLLERLDSPFLHELTISYNGLTPAAVPHISSFLTSPRCRLRVLKLSANKLGLRGVWSLVTAMDKNYTLTSIELYSNDEDDEDHPDEQGLPTRLEIWNFRNALQSRNDLFRRQVEHEALDLLRHSRALLLGLTSQIPTATFSIPMELQLHILSFFAPTLTDSQRVRIFQYASTKETLPRLLPSLAPHGCLGNPASLPFGLGVRGGGCSNGQCMGSANSVSCRKDNERLVWLTEVGCDVYIPQGV